MYTRWFGRLRRHVGPVGILTLLFIPILVSLAPVLAGSQPTPHLIDQPAAPSGDPTPGSSGWAQVSSATFGYSVRYPASWTPRDEGAIDNATAQLLTFRAPGATADLLRLQVSRRSYADTLDLVRHELNDQPLTPATIGGHSLAIGTGPAYDGGIVRVAIIPTAHATLLLALHASGDADPNLATFEQLLATLQVNDGPHVFLPLVRR